MPKKPTRSKLEAALRDQRLVRIERSLRHADRIDGFVVGMGAKWALIACTRDGGFFDGCAAVRIRDVKAVREDRSFEERFARIQPEWPPVGPDVDLDKTAVLLVELGQFAPLVSIGQEDLYKFDGRWIGIPDSVEDGWLWLHEVRPDAAWRSEPRGYRLSRITYVEIGSAYLVGLHTIAGPRPTS